MPNTALQRRTISAGGTRLVRFDFTNDLDSAASLNTLTSILEVTTTALTLTAKAITTADYTDDKNNTVAAGKAVEFLCAGGTAGTTYRIRTIAVTDETNAQTLVWDCLVTFV